MTLSKSSRRFRKAAIGLSVALLISAVAAPTSNATKVQGPRDGGTITVGIFDLIPTYCFGTNLANSAIGAIKTVFEGLVEKRADGVVVPFLLKSFSSADKVNWTLKVRPNIKFHNGEAFDAAAVKLNLEAYRGTLASVYGLHTFGSGVPFNANVKAITVVDSSTLIVTLWRAQPDYMDSVYASGRAFMRAPAMIKSAATCLGSPIGTGPFKWVSGNPQSFVVAKNTSYWRKDAAGNKLPYLNKINFKYIAEPSQRANGIRSGTVTAAMFSSASEGQQINTISNDPKIQVIASPDDYYPMIFLNQAIAPFNNVHARKAVAYAFDVATFYKARNCVKGTCYGNIPTSIVGPRNVMYTTAGFLSYNLGNAKKELAAYKADTGLTLAFTIPAAETTTSLANAKAYQQILQKAGMTITINQETSAAIVTKAFPTPGTSAGNPYQFLPILLAEGRGTAFTIPFLVSNTANDVGNGMNFTGLKPFYSLLSLTRHKDAAIDKALFDARASGSPAALKAALKLVQQSALVVATPTLQYYFGLNAKLRGFDTFRLASGGNGVPMTNAGINWTGVYIQK